jgi:hypothetical protein
MKNESTNAMAVAMNAILLKDLQNTQKGRCLVVGHGVSIHSFPWEKVGHIPKILVNFYEPRYKYILAVICWDKDILKEIHTTRAKILKQGNIWENPAIVYTGAVEEYKPDIYIKPENFPPNSKNNVFSGARALYFAQYIGFEEIYLVGYDFIPHNQAKYLAQEKEIQTARSIQEYNETFTIEKGLQTQIDNFSQVQWLHNNVFQTNPNSKLTFFKYKQLGELL